MKNICIALSAFLLAAPTGLHSQAAPPSAPTSTPADSSQPASPPQATPAPSASPPFSFSGVLYANYQYRGEQGPSKSANKFDLERAYLTFRVPAGDRASVRVTADVFQQQATGSDAFYRGWVIRAKYAFLQYDFLKSAGWSGLVRAGLVQTVVIEHVENFWPRWLSNTPVERAGFFASADGGVGGLITLPNGLGEVYTNITNGPGYTSREIDRFKDYAARLTLTPFGSSKGFLQTFAVTGWTYRGAIASRFAAGGPGQIGTVGSSLARNRSGIFAGIKHPGLTLGGDYATRTDGSESGENTVLMPRAETDSTGRLVSGFAVLRPFQLVNDRSSVPLGLVARWDRFKPNRDAAAYSNTVIAGVIWDLNKRTSISLDYQEQTSHHGPVVPNTRTYFLHLVANY